MQSASDIVGWENKKQYYKNLYNRRLNMAVINFTEQDLLNAEKRKKKMALPCHMHKGRAILT